MSQAATSTGPLHLLKDKLSGKQVILVQGACGTIGYEIVQAIKTRINTQSNIAVVAGVSDMNDPNTKCLHDLDIDIIHLDLRNHDLVQNAFTLNVQKLVVIPPFLNNRVPLVSRLIDMAHTKGVKHVVFVTLLGTHTEELGIFRDLKTIQNKLRSCSDTMPFTFVGCTAIMENCFRMKKMIQSGSLCLPLGTEGKWVAISAKDVANFVTKCIVDGVQKNSINDITGPEALTGQQIAKILTDNLKKQVNYVSSLPDEFRTFISQEGVPAVKSDDLRDLFEWYSKGNGNRVTNDFETVVGTKPRTFAQFVQENLARFQ